MFENLYLMKKLTTTFFLISFFLISNATVWIVDNNPGAMADFSDLQDAIDGSFSGDTLYMNGSPISHGNVSIDHKLIILGPGKNPQKEGGNQAIVGKVTLNLGSDGTVFSGIKGNAINAATQVDNISIMGCRLQSISVAGVNYLIENCVVSNGSAVAIASNMTGSSNILIQNNIIGSGLQKFDSPSVYVRNNVFVDENDAFATFYGTPVKYAIVENNIFYGRGPSSCATCTFNNNLTFGTNQDTIPYGTNIGSNNVSATNPDFENVPLPGFVNISYAHQYSWKLDAGSAGAGKGTDGKDIGLYGGADVYTPGGEPDIPQIRRMTLKNTTVPPGGTLELEVVSTSGKQ